MSSTKETSNINYNDFMSKHNVKNEIQSEKTIGFTHTRIPDKDLQIYGGSYIIPKVDQETFYNLYYENVFVKKRKEYLTERQLENGGPMVVDFDFRYKSDVIERQHTEEHISDMICEYLEILDMCYTIETNTPFDIFIFEKPNVNRLEDGSLTKDGIHMLIGLQVNHTMQTLIRKKMLNKITDIWDMPIINSWDSVLDEGISKGKTNWQLFGSRKPGNEAYEFTRHYRITKDESDKQFRMEDLDVSVFDLKKNFAKLSVQYDKNPKFELNPKIIDEYNLMLENKGPKIQKASTKVKRKLIIEDADDENDTISINEIVDSDTLEKAMNIILKNLQANEYEIKETHQFTQALPEKYYNPGSHLLNRQVAFALKYTDERLFLSWVMLRSKASDFDYNTIPELYNEWKKFHKSNINNDSVTRKSIMYWLRKDNNEEYIKIKQQTIDYYLEKAFETGTEYDFALILKQMYKENYVCVSYDKKGVWYNFRNHRWVLDKGLTLRTKISEELSSLFVTKIEQLSAEMADYVGNEEKMTFLKKKIKNIIELKIKLKKTNDKNNIMREAAEIFYDGEFIKNMDTKKHLMCFNNGVVDFKNKIFRDGCPEDYITKTTRINYIPYNEIINPSDTNEYYKTSEFLTTFMKQLFPIPDLNRYMWDHLSSCLIGTNKNQTFNVYHGSGSNGKSIIADLMAGTLGEYKGTVPITLVTEKRGLIGGTSDEVLKLKGVRYAVMQEPSKGVKLNEGIMKELTGGDPIQARGLYSESEIFEPQFNLVVCTNNLFDIESNDDGTWRRIRKCDFVSKFVDQAETYNDKTAYIFPKDKSLKDKLTTLSPVFASMLVNRAFETEGIVLDCETVLNASSKYRKGQDHIDAFISDKIIRTNDPSDKMKKTEAHHEFKKWYEESQGTRKIPKGEELYAAIQKRFDPITYTNAGWEGIKINYPQQDS
jgi:P4 family phage/plasmid primase-like protien